MITKATPLVDRYLASEFHPGSISHLNYAFKIVTVIAALVSIGLSTVIFPRMAQDVAQSNLTALRSTLSHGLRLMWILTAPIISIGFSLALPIVILLFKRGAFNDADVQVVTGLLRIYVFGVFGMALGNVTSKGFYVLKDTRTLALVGIFEAVSYVVYTVLMTKYLGLQGIAIGCVIYCTVAVVWQVVVLNFKTGGHSGRVVVVSYLKTAFAALLAGIVSYFISLSSLDNIPKIALGSFLGMVSYMIVLKIVRSEELNLIWELVCNVFNPKAENSVQTK